MNTGTFLSLCTVSGKTLNCCHLYYKPNTGSPLIARLFLMSPAHAV